MEYQDLATLYYRDSSPDRKSRIEGILAERRRSDSTFDLGFDLPSGGLFLAVPRVLSLLNQKILQRERKVSSLMKCLPGIAGNEVLRSLVMDEIVMSNSIENIHSTRKQIEQALASSSTSNLRDKRFREFAKLYIELISGEYTVPETPEDIRRVYDRIMDGEALEEPPDGELFRAGPVVITDGLKQIHSGVTPESAIVEAMESMISLVSSAEIPELYSALASHYIFEYIHPFYDGNGRTGRYLLAMYLEAALSKPTALSLSRVIAEHRDSYYGAFRNVENPLNHGELTFFVITMHELILQAQDELIDRLEKNIVTLEAIRRNVIALKQRGEYSGKELDIIHVLLQQKAFGVSSSMPIATLSGHIGLGTQQTRKYLSSLEQRNVVKKTRGRDPLTFALTDRFLEENGMCL